MRIIGLDPGLRLTGWGVIEARGARTKGIDAGVLTLGRGDLEGRLVKLFDGLSEIVEEHAPTEAAVEDIFFAKYANAALKLGRSIWVVSCWFAAAVIATISAGIAVLIVYHIGWVGMALCVVANLFVRRYVKVRADAQEERVRLAAEERMHPEEFSMEDE